MVIEHVVASDLAIIWNNEIVSNGIFPNKLKLADITPVHKKLEKTFKANYRNVSILRSVSKVFENFMGANRSIHGAISVKLFMWFSEGV